MANTVTLLSFANTFGDWVVTTNKLAQENNDLAANNYIKPTGTLFLNSPSLGLQVANNATIQGQLQVSGIGSSAYIQKNLQVDGSIIGASNNYFIVSDSNNIFNITQSGSGLAIRINSQPGGSGVTGQNTTVIDANGNVYIGSASAGPFKLNVANGNVNFAQNLTVGSNVTSQIVRTTNHVVSKDVTASANVLGDRIQANTNLISPTLAVSGTAFINAVQANSTVNTQTLTVTSSAIVDNLRGNTFVWSPIVVGSNNVVSDIVSGNTRVVSPSILGTTSVVGGVVFANTHVSSPTITGSNNVIGDIISGNTRVISQTIIAISDTISDRVTANIAISTPRINVSSLIDANTADLYVDDIVANTMSIQGNFVVNGDTVYNSDTFTLNSDAAIPQNANFVNYRGVGNANAIIRWNELQDYWDLRDVNNPSSFSQILTANLISDSLISTSSSTVASSAAANATNSLVRSAFNSANAGVILAGSAFNSANAGVTLATAAYSSANAGVILATAAYSRANTGTLASNTFVGTTGTATPTTGVISFNSTNGVTISGAANVLTISTSQDLRTSASPTFASLTLSSPLALAQGGTGATSASGALTNILPTGTLAGYVLTTGGPGNFYWSAPTGGGGGATPGTTINSTRLSYTANAVPLVTFTTPTFSTGTQLRAYINGVRQFESEYTANISNSTISFTVAPELNDSILLEVDGFINNPYYANNIAFTSPQGGIVASANTIQLAINDLESRKATIASPSFTGYPLAPTADVAVSNTQIATTAYVNNKANSGVRFTASVTGSAGSVANTGITGLITNAQLAGPIGATLTDDTTSSDTRFVTFTPQTSGTQTIANTSSSKLTYVPSTGTLSSTIITSTSDINQKINIVEISDALNTVMQLNGVEYNWKDTGDKGMGLIAQDVEKIIPYLVAENENGKSIMYQNMVGLLIEAIKELKREIDSLKGDNK